MFTPEVFAAITHLRYGNHVQVQGYSVPLRWNDVVTHGESSLLVSHWPGRFRADWLGSQDSSMVSYSPLSAKEKEFAYSRDHAAIDQAFLKIGERFTSRQLNIAGTPYGCWEFEPDSRLNIGDKSAWNIDCRPEGDGLRIFFFGNRRQIPSFYDGLATIKRIKD